MTNSLFSPLEDDLLFPDMGKLDTETRTLPGAFKRLLMTVMATAPESAEVITARRIGETFPFYPARILMQDFTGVPAVADLAALRDTLAENGKNPRRVDPAIAVDLVIDHSLSVAHAGTGDACALNMAAEFAANRERYAFLRWAGKTFEKLRVIPPGMGICHQVNLERLAQVICRRTIGGRDIALPDTLIGTDSHTVMVNGLGVLGWGVGGIEAESAMLGRPVNMALPPSVGVYLTGTPDETVTATDLALRITESLRAHGVVGKFVEFHGPATSRLSLPDRATIANMAPEFRATCGLFPVDEVTMAYLKITGRPPAVIRRAEAVCRAAGLWGEDSPPPVFEENLTVDLSRISRTLAGPSRPQDALSPSQAAKRTSVPPQGAMRPPVRDGDVVLAAIASCTNTANPALLAAAGLLAQRAAEKGLGPKGWVKTSFTPGSRAISAFLKAAGLQAALDSLGFNVAGFACATCIGNSGPLLPGVQKDLETRPGTEAAAVISGNRNFEGRIHALTRANYLTSPPMVVAYALLGTMAADPETAPLGQDFHGKDVYLADIWPTREECEAVVNRHLSAPMFSESYENMEHGPGPWRDLPTPAGETFDWPAHSTMIRRPSFVHLPPAERTPDIRKGRILLCLGDSVTTDHISPASPIPPESPAGCYLQEKGVRPADLGTYGGRRGNHEVMMRGTFSNPRLNNALAGRPGGWTRTGPKSPDIPVFEAAEHYAETNTPLIVLAGDAYGTGSSRDWAAKGPALLGVQAVVARNFERIHRANLAGMGILPLKFAATIHPEDLGLTGAEKVNLTLNAPLAPKAPATLCVSKKDGKEQRFALFCRLETPAEVEIWRRGGILPHVAADLLTE